MKKDSLNTFKTIIRSVEDNQHKDDLKTKIELFKVKLILNDGSILHITEIYKYGSLLKYSYYWLTSSNALKIGWDNAPHHTHLKTFPHHKHLAGKKKPIESDERNLADMLAFITKQLN